MTANNDVFVNVPFDAEYEPLLVALISGLATVGLVARSVVEIPANKDRLTRLKKLIRSCQSSVHDLSCVESTGGCPRFNMPFELGLAVGLKTTDRWIVLERKRHRLGKTLSDLNGYDPYIHEGKPELVLQAISNAFKRRKPPHPTLANMKRVHRNVVSVAAKVKAEHGPILTAEGFRAFTAIAQGFAEGEVLGKK